MLSLSGRKQMKMKHIFCQQHLLECTRHVFLHLCDMNVLLILVNKITYLHMYVYNNL